MQMRDARCTWTRDERARWCCGCGDRRDLRGSAAWRVAGGARPLESRPLVRGARASRTAEIVVRTMCASDDDADG